MSSNNDEIQKTAQSGTTSNTDAIKQTAQAQSISMSKRALRDSSQHRRSLNESLDRRYVTFTKDDEDK